MKNNFHIKLNCLSKELLSINVVKNVLYLEIILKVSYFNNFLYYSRLSKV